MEIRKRTNNVMTHNTVDNYMWWRWTVTFKTVFENVLHWTTGVPKCKEGRKRQIKSLCESYWEKHTWSKFKMKKDFRWELEGEKKRKTGLSRGVGRGVVVGNIKISWVSFIHINNTTPSVEHSTTGTGDETRSTTTQ